jgi:hypothetical protein
VVVIVSLHLYFKAAGWGKESGLYPPSGWCQENSWSWCFLQVGAYESRGWCLLPVGVGEFREL